MQALLLCTLPGSANFSVISPLMANAHGSLPHYSVLFQSNETKWWKKKRIIIITHSLPIFFSLRGEEVSMQSKSTSARDHIRLPRLNYHSHPLLFYIFFHLELFELHKKVGNLMYRLHFWFHRHQVFFYWKEKFQKSKIYRSVSAKR